MLRIVFLFVFCAFVFGKDFLWENVEAQSTSKSSPQFDWPVLSDKISDRITSTFGESRWDHFHNGLDIASFYESARAIGDSKLLYSRYSSDDPFREEWGSGDTVWLDHGGSYYSAYYHLNPGRANLTSDLKKGQVVGTTGNTGHSSGGHLHFVLAKDYGKTIVNPLRYLPPTIDEMPPLIGGLSVHVGERFSNINTGDTINLSGSFPFTIYIQDSGVRNSQRWGVQAVQFRLNGKPIKESRFQSIQFKNGIWLNDDGVSFPELFYRDKYFIGNLSLPSGEHTIEVIASDYHGNSARKSFTFYVNRI